jgi:ABC-2 type transport system ATP-binding protein
MNPIEIENLTKTFRGKKGRRVEALKNLTLSVSRGEVFGFLGPNGAGKSTTIKTLLGQIRPTDGSASLFGKPVGHHAARRNVGYLPENPSFYDYLTAREFLDLVGRTHGMPVAEVRRKTDTVLEKLSLEEASKRPIKGFSKGMIQRLGIAQTLLHDPDLYILDEPMSGLDPVGRALVKDLMVDLKSRGKTIFFSTHVISDVEAVCDRVAIVVQGELRAENAVRELVSEGITGYQVRLEQIPPAELNDYLAGDASGGQGLLYVPRHQFNVFMRKVDQLNCVVHLIEPQRNSLEDFFLKTIA